MSDLNCNPMRFYFQRTKLVAVTFYEARIIFQLNQGFPDPTLEQLQDLAKGDWKIWKA